MDLQSVTEELYTLHPTQFVEARTARVVEALAAGKAVLAAQIAALRRPTLSAWASNLLVHSEPEKVARLLRLGEGLRRAHQKLSHTQLRRLSQQQRRLVRALSQQARTLAAEAGHPIGEAAQRKVEETLHAALADPAAAEKWASGRLVRALARPVGFAAVAAAKTSRDHRRTDAGRKSARTKRRAETAEQRARQREEEHDQAQAEVERAETALRELEERATELAQQLHATVELRRQLRDKLDRARNRAAQTGRAGPQARHATDTARPGNRRSMT